LRRFACAVASAVLCGVRRVAWEKDALRTAHTTSRPDDKQHARRSAHGLGHSCGKLCLVFHRQSAMAARRLRPGEAGVYFLPNGQRGLLAVPTNPTSARRNETATGRMDFGSAFYLNAIMGCSVAVTVIGRCGRLGAALVPLC